MPLLILDLTGVTNIVARSFQSRASSPRFGDPVCYNCGKRRHTHYFFLQSQILESLIMEMVDKILINRDGVVLIGSLNRETEYCPCLVAKWSGWGLKKCRTESRFADRIV